MYAQFTYTRFVDTEDRHQLYLPLERGTVTALDGSSGTVTGISRARRDLRIREKDQELAAGTVGFEKQLDRWKFTGQLGLSEGTERRPDELTVRFRRGTSDTGLNYRFDGPYALRLEQTAGASLADPASYNQVDRIELTNARGEETEVNATLDARHDFSATAHAQVGASYRSKEKTSAVDIVRYAAPATFTFANLAGPVNPDYPFGLRVPRLSHDAVSTAFNGNRAAFTPTVQLEDSALEDWKSKEEILAGYALAGVTLGSATHLIAGLRAERTEFDTRGNQLRGGQITPTSAGRTYDHLLPGVHLRHDFTPRWVARAAYSESLVRPAFAETALFRSVADNDFEVSSGNPGLGALESQNWDASLDYYLPSLGVVSAALFYKQIKNFSYEITVPDGDPALPGYDLLTFRNGSDGIVKGLELAYQQQLRFLPAPLDGLGFLANGTFVDSEAAYPTRPGEKLPFIGQSDVSGNLALTYEKRGLFVRLALNWRDEHLREDEPLGADRDGDRWIDDYAQLDLSASYRLGRQWELFAEVSNLTNEPFRVFFKSSNGQGARLVQFEEYDWTAQAGVRWKL